jgi:hypothetical protein
VVIDDALRADVGTVGHLACCHEGLEAIGEPRVHPLSGFEVVRVKDEALIGVRPCLIKFLLDILVLTAVDGLALRAIRSLVGLAGHVPPVFTLTAVCVIVDPLDSGRHK